MDLFDHAASQRMSHEAPLAARMRPRTLDEYVGQQHIVGPGTLLRRAIELAMSELRVQSTSEDVADFVRSNLPEFAEKQGAP